MTCNPYLSFNGNCREAFQRYAQVLDGKIVMMMTNGEMPGAPEMPPEARDAIMHARLEFDGQVLMGGDAPGGRFKTPTGFAVTLGVETVERAAAIFNALAEGGTTQMPFQDTFWAAKFGMVTDRFGTPWIINGEPRV